MLLRILYVNMCDLIIQNLRTCHSVKCLDFKEAHSYESIFLQDLIFILFHLIWILGICDKGYLLINTEMFEKFSEMTVEVPPELGKW